MTLPFTTGQFLEVFRQYNTAIWPLQVVLVGVALAAVALVVLERGGKVVSLCLAGLWAWTGIVYQWLFFTRVNPAAWLFGALWIGGAALFAWNSMGVRALGFRARQPARQAIGATLLAYALVVYPILGYVDGRAYPFSPTFGAPCPVTIATLGILWLARAPVPRYLLIAPLVWAAIGSLAAFALGVREDLGLLAAGLASLALLVPPASRSGLDSTGK